MSAVAPERCIDLSDGPLLDADELGQLLHVRPSTVREHARRRRGSLPSVRIGRARRFYVREVEAWLVRESERGR